MPGHVHTPQPNPARAPTKWRKGHFGLADAAQTNRNSSEQSGLIREGGHKDISAIRKGDIARLMREGDIARDKGAMASLIGEGDMATPNPPIATNSNPIGAVWPERADPKTPPRVMMQDGDAACASKYAASQASSTWKSEVATSYVQM